MYKQFVDTIDQPGAEEMPAEAMKLNGSYIENLIDSRYATYRTLYVQGREMLSPNLSTYETGVRDGSRLLGRRYPERVITVGYSLQASSNYYFRIAYNELMRILNVENAEIIFYDEQDKYFIGTPSGMSDVDTGTNFVKGEITILCDDPFKYSIIEYEVEPMSDGTFVIDYNGTYKGYPVLEADFYEQSECGDDGNTPTTLTASGDCGFVAWFKATEDEEDEDYDSKIIQLGDPDEEDTESYAKSQTLVSQEWKQVSAWTEALNNLWAKNTGRVTSGVSAQIGTMGFDYSADQTSYGYYMTPSSYGSNSDGYHGPSVTRTIPADASGETGAKDWTLKWSMKINIGKGTNAEKNCGAVQVLVTDSSEKIIAGMNVYKSATGTSGNMRAYVNNGIAKTVSIDLSYHNTRFGTNSSSSTSVKSCSITKSGSTVTMNLGGTSWSFTNSSITNMVATQFTATITQYKAKPAMPWNGIYKFIFTKNNCDTWADIPNKFTLNDTVVADCTDGQVYLNDAPEPSYGALGNDWEEFYLSPGYNQIGFAYSDWCDLAPTSKIRYREVFL